MTGRASGPSQRRFLSLFPDFAEPVLRRRGSNAGCRCMSRKRAFGWRSRRRLSTCRATPISAFSSASMPPSSIARSRPRMRCRTRSARPPWPSAGPQMVRGRGGLLSVALQVRRADPDRHPAGQQAARRDQDADPGFHRVPERDQAARRRRSRNFADITASDRHECAGRGVLRAEHLLGQPGDPFRQASRRDAAASGRLAMPRSRPSIWCRPAIRTIVLSKQRDLQKAPILRNLVPAQLLMGRSSFNSGNSISAGLPNYARGRIKAIAAIIEQE